MAGVKYVLYKRCVEGDRLKVRAESNMDETAGGGARDLRFNPWHKFQGVVEDMFDNVQPIPRSPHRSKYTAPVYWREGGQTKGPETVEFWDPTDSRPGEGRLSKVHLVTPFDESHLPPAINDPFFFLWQDLTNTVWAQYVTVADLRAPGWHPAVAQPILKAVTTQPAASNIRGWVNVQSGLKEQVYG